MVQRSFNKLNLRAIEMRRNMPIRKMNIFTDITHVTPLREIICQMNNIQSNEVIPSISGLAKLFVCLNLMFL